MSSFSDRLFEATQTNGNVLCGGIDPHLHLIPPFFRRGDMSPTAPATLEAVRDFCFELLVCLKNQAAVIKPQSALFEQLGGGGMMLLADLCRAAHDEKMLLIMDAKRGDIGSTSAAYAKAFLGQEASFPSDALTLNPYLGIDTIQPFIDAADATASGLFILVRTSNAGSADLQTLRAHDGRPLFHHLADKLRPLIDDRIGKYGFSSIGIVAGATYPEEAALLRQLLPSALFLVPGFGAQGAGREAAFAGLVRTQNNISGGVVNASRGISFPPDAADAKTRNEWQQAVKNAVSAATQELSIRQ